jgi:hypothetical protein
MHLPESTGAHLPITSCGYFVQCRRPGTIRRNRCLASPDRSLDVDSDDTGPQSVRHLGSRHQRMGNQALINRDHVVGSVTPQPSAADVVHGERHSGPPAQPIDFIGQRLHLYLHVHFSEAAQLLGDDCRLQPTLCL